MLIIQTRFLSSNHCSKDIRKFINERLINVMKGKLKIKVWIKDEKLTLLKYKSVMKK